MDTQKSIFIIVGVLVAGLLIGYTFTGQAVRKKLLIGDGDGGGGCNDIDNDRYFGQSNCGTLKDCNDNNPYVYPGAEEICGNNIDDDCSNGDIGLCQASAFIRTSKVSYLSTEGVTLK